MQPEMGERNRASERASEWEPRRELGESIVLIGFLLATVGLTAGFGLMAMRVLAG